MRESLRWLHQQGYLIVVMSNNSVNSLRNVEGKSGIHAKLARKFGRIENLATAAAVPLLALVGVAGNSERTNMCRFYKPNTGMWDWLCEIAAPAIGAQICRSSSFFVGDSAGRRPGQNGAGPKGKIATLSRRCHVGLYVSLTLRVSRLQETSGATIWTWRGMRGCASSWRRSSSVLAGRPRSQAGGGCSDER